MQIHLALAGALPALGLMAYFDRLDARRPEPRSTLRRVSVAGGLSVIPVIGAELGLMKGFPMDQATYEGALFHAFVVAAAVEELAKVLCLYLVVWRRPEFDERMDGIVYATRAGLGFALVENVMYLVGTDSPREFLLTFVLRAVLAVPGHAIWAGLMGYFAARRKFDGAGPGLLGGYLVALLLHGAYDAGIFVAPALHLDGYSSLIYPMLSVPVLVVLIGGIALRRLARKAIALDDAQHAGRPSRRLGVVYW